MKKIVIVGAGCGWDMVREYEEKKDYEIWCVPSIYPVLASHRVDKIFEIHPSEKWQAGIDYANINQQLFLPHPDPRAPNATIFSINSLQVKYGMVFSSTIAWMLGYALLNKVEEIVFLGVDMTNGYENQRDGLFFLLGYAKAARVKVTIPQSSKINIFGKSYGWV